jgi:hypothetical protein
MLMLIVASVLVRVVTLQITLPFQFTGKKST